MKTCQICKSPLPRYRSVYCPSCEPYANDAGEKIVYFIQQGEYGPVKIGSTKNPKKRLYLLQYGNPDPLFLRATLLNVAEKSLHERFGHLLIRGEWFRYKEPLVSYMEELPEVQPEKSSWTMEPLF